MLILIKIQMKRQPLKEIIRFIGVSFYRKD